jgi:hypothetical protein
MMSEADATYHVKDRTNEVNIGDLSDYMDVKHAEIKAKRLLQIKEENFSKMKFYQDCGFNIMCFGVGSKRDILNAYAVEHISWADHSVSIVNGYNPGTGIKSVLGSIFNYL